MNRVSRTVTKLCDFTGLLLWKRHNFSRFFYRRNAHNLCRFCISVCRFRENDAVAATSNWQNYIWYWRTYLRASMSEAEESNRILDVSVYMHWLHTLHPPPVSCHSIVTAMSLPCHAMPCHVMSCHVMGYHGISRQCHFTASCHCVIPLRHSTVSCQCVMPLCQVIVSCHCAMSLCHVTQAV